MPLASVWSSVSAFGTALERALVLARLLTSRNRNAAFTKIILSVLSQQFMKRSGFYGKIFYELSKITGEPQEALKFVYIFWLVKTTDRLRMSFA